jgi:hypothetical protein
MIYKSLPLILMLFLNSICEEFPQGGLFTTESQNSALLVFCNKIDSDNLECEFTQISVRNKVKEDDWKKKTAAAQANFKEFLKELERDACDSMDLYLDYIQDKAKSKNSILHEYFEKMSGEEKQNAISHFKSIKQVCKSKNVDDYLKMERKMFDKDLKTCNISAYPYKQRFKLVKDKSSGTFSWLADGTPSGPCGIVQLARFVPIDVSGITSWEYVARKEVTNKNATSNTPIKCSEFDESKMIYELGSNIRQVGCEYIEFTYF